MSSFSVTFEPPLSVLQQQFRSVGITSFLQDEIRRLAIETGNEAKRETPVDLSGLRASISPSIGPGLSATIRPHVPYAHWIHEGWEKIGGRIVRIKGHGRAGTPPGGKPYMFLGVEKALSGFENRMAARLEFRIKSKIRRL